MKDRLLYLEIFFLDLGGEGKKKMVVWSIFYVVSVLIYVFYYMVFIISLRG